jgi:hypothetical protein
VVTLVIASRDHCVFPDRSVAAARRQVDEVEAPPSLPDGSQAGVITIGFATRPGFRSRERSTMTVDDRRARPPRPRSRCGSHIAALIGTIVAVGVVVGIYNYGQTSRIVLEAMDDVFRRMGRGDAQTAQRRARQRAGRRVRATAHRRSVDSR